MTKDLDAPGDACLDAETLAAWADEALDARERAAVEAHASDCARCQALLAAMVRTQPPPTAAVSPFRTRPLWWLAALTPVAAALVVWFAVPQRVPVQQSQPEAFADQAAPAAVPAPAAPAASAPAAEAPAEGRARELADARQQPALDAERDVASLDRKAAPTARANALSVAEAVAGAAPGAPPAPVAESSLRREAAAAPARPATFANPLDSLIVSSNPATRFRILPGGNVQRSADGGATWRSETTGATVTLTAGSSPSPSVCWLIGPNGLVLLSTNGPSWRRIAFPEAVDLRSVVAVDGDNATVTTADGRAFTTTDGGQSWSRAPEL